ncbi:MAG: hypothetical protein RSD45_08440 [Gordonibacter sp.]
MESEDFAKGTERMVDPITVGSIHFMQQFYGMMPLGMQRKLLARASETTPYMGFVVEPYAFFLFYEIADERRASSLLPSGFRLAEARVFEGDEPAHYAIMSFFRVHTSAFWGSRAEFYLVAEDERTGLLSWVIVDYASDTISYDRKHGLRAPSAPPAVMTTTYDGRVLVDMASIQDGGRTAFSATLENSHIRKLDTRLWIEGNLSVGYGKSLSEDNSDVFSLTFLPEEMGAALDVPLENLRLEQATWCTDMLAPKPSKLACFPFAQHLLSDSPGFASGHSTEEELREAARSVDFGALKTFSIGSVRKSMLASMAITVGMLAILVVALILK